MPKARTPARDARDRIDALQVDTDDTGAFDTLCSERARFDQRCTDDMPDCNTSFEYSMGTGIDYL